MLTPSEESAATSIQPPGDFERKFDRSARGELLHERRRLPEPRPLAPAREGRQGELLGQDALRPFARFGGPAFGREEAGVVVLRLGQRRSGGRLREQNQRLIFPADL